MSPAQKLATLDQGHPVPADDTTTGEYSAVLEQLEPACRESQEKLAAEIWATGEDMRKSGVPGTTSLDVGRALAEATDGLPSRTKPTDCVSLLAADALLAEQDHGK
jgi:hypothetical protein